MWWKIGEDREVIASEGSTDLKIFNNVRGISIDGSTIRENDWGN